MLKVMPEEDPGRGVFKAKDESPVAEYDDPGTCG